MMRSRFNVVAVGLLAGIALVACGGSEATELADQPVEAAGVEAAADAPADTLADASDLDACEWQSFQPEVPACGFLGI